MHYAPSSLMMSTFLIRSANFDSSSYLIVLKGLGGPRSRPNYLLYNNCALDENSAVEQGIESVPFGQKKVCNH